MSARRPALRGALAALALLGVGVVAASCGGDDPGHKGELMIVIQTDMALPKDVDRARIEVLAYGDHFHDEEYERLGSDESLKLPGTLGILVGEDPSTPVTIRITAWQGANPRVLREAVSTVPENRLASLRLPVQWLCDGTAVDDGTGNVVSTCGEGKTCVAGSCVPTEVDSSELPDYDEEDVFGGGSGDGDGSCFDTAECMRGSVLLERIEGAACAFTSIGGELSVALQTEGDGICGPAGCFIPLDAGSEAGWTDNGDGTLTLPQAVCDKLAADPPQIVGVAAVNTAEGCPQKDETLPTCGPWSNTGEQPEPPGVDEPIALATGQNHPSGLVLDEANQRVYWTNRGSFSAEGIPLEDASLRGMPKDGGSPTTVLEGLAGMRDLAIAGDFLFFTASGTGADSGRALGVPIAGGEAVDLIKNAQGPLPVAVPEGIAIRDDVAFITAFGSGDIWVARTSGEESFAISFAAQQNYPYRIAADESRIYWTNVGSAGGEQPDGAVLMLDDVSQDPDLEPVVLAQGEAPPRDLALQLGGDGNATAVWYTTFAEGGALKRVGPGGGEEPETLVEGQSFPNGVTVDEAFVYWTNRGDGTVWKLPLGAAPGDAPTQVASGQVAPGPIAVDATHIYWANEGTSSESNGSIIKIAKPAAQ